MSTTVVAALSTTQIHALTTDQIKALTTAEIGAIHTAHLNDTNQSYYSQAQMDAMSPEQLSKMVSSPIVLNLDGMGIQTVAAAAGIHFDLNASGSNDNVGWITSGSGFLVEDINNNGIIDNGSELFGTATKLSNGTTAQDGFAALRALDTNGDGVLTSADAAWNSLKVWVDGNMDGASQTSELFTLQSLGVASLNLNAVKTATGSNGNWTLLDSTYTTTDGTVRDLADVYFDNHGTTGAISSLATDQLGAISAGSFTTLSADGPAPALASTAAPSFAPQVVSGLTEGIITALAGSATTANNFAGTAPTPFIASLNANQVLDTALLNGEPTEAAVLNGQQNNWKPASTMIVYGDDQKSGAVGPHPAQVPGGSTKDFLS